MVNSSGNSALHLVALAADGYSVNKWRRSAMLPELKEDQLQQQQIECIEALLDAGCPQDACNTVGHTALAVLDSLNCSDRARQLLQVHLRVQRHVVNVRVQSRVVNVRVATLSQKNSDLEPHAIPHAL